MAKAKPKTKINKKGKTLTLSASGKTYQNLDNNGLSSQLSGAISTAKAAGVDTPRAEAMQAQHTAQGAKPFKGSSYEAGVISSKQGEKLVDTAAEKITRLTPEDPMLNADQLMADSQAKLDQAKGMKLDAPTAAQPGPVQQPETSSDFVTYYNQSTGQEQTLRGQAMNDTNRKALQEQGYTLASSDSSAAQQNPEIARLDKEVNNLGTELSGYLKSLETTLVTDKELKGELRTISRGYDARMDEMRGITERRKQTIETLATRMGARYTGGMGGITGGLISEEERQGLARITSIENDKQSALQKAKEAARNNNYGVYTKLADQAERLQVKKANELTNLKEAQRKQDEKIALEKKQSEYDALIGEQLVAGVTDATELFKNLGGKVPFDQIGEIIKLMPKAPEDFTLSEGQARYDAQGNQIAARAKTYEPKTPAIPGNMTAGQVSAFNSIVGKYNSSPLVQAADRTTVLKNAITDIRKNPSDGALQINLAYSYIQALDTYQSAVREGELSLVNSIDSKVGQIQNWTTQINNGQTVRPEVAKQIADAAEKVVDTINEAASRKAQSFQSQAQTVGLGSQWQQYISGFEQNYSIEQFKDTTNADLLGFERTEEFSDPNGIYP